MIRVLVFITVLFSTNAIAENKIESWECQEKSYGNWSKILVQATVGSDRVSGKIHVAGIIHDATFEVNGFNRRWNFDLSDDNTYDFAFIIKPNGDASYYDFSTEKQTKPSLFLYCRETK
jgi:hypothetical protein